MVEPPEGSASTPAAQAPEGDREPWTPPRVFVSEMRDGRNGIGVIYEFFDVKS